MFTDLIKANQKENSFFKISRLKIAIVSAILIVLGTSNIVFTVLAFGLNAFFIVLNNSDETLLQLFFLCPFANIFKISATSSSIFTYLLILWVIKTFIKERYIDKNFIIMWLIYVGYSILGSSLNITLLIKQMVIPVFVFLCLQKNYFTIFSYFHFFK